MVVNIKKYQDKKELEEARAYIISKGLNPDAYGEDIVNIAKGLKKIEELEKKYGIKF